MRIGMYDPYLDTLGGGERYILTLASCLSSEHQVELLWNEKDILKKAEEKFGRELKNIEITPSLFSSTISSFERYKRTKKYDAFFMISDGSVPFLGSKKVFLIYQFPMPWVRYSTLDTIKLRTVTKVLCYSTFVQKELMKLLGKKVSVLYPPVEQLGEKMQKKNIILSVGRFTKSNNAKKQDVMIDAFKKLFDSQKNDWELHLAGSFLPEDKDMVEGLKDRAKGYPIFLHSNVSFAEIKNLYNSAKIYWHAAGFGEDLEKHPERAEHFGISTVEAMSAGCVPIVINAGGQKEIVENAKDGYLWDSIDELLEMTKKVMNSEKEFGRLSKNAKVKAEDFSVDKFCYNVKKLL